MSQMTTDRFHLVSIMHVFLILQLLTVVLNYTTPCIWFMPKKANIFIWQIGLTIWHIYTYALHFPVQRILTFLCLFYEFCSCFVMHYNHLILFIKSNMTGVTSETGIAYPHLSSSRFLVAFVLVRWKRFSPCLTSILKQRNIEHSLPYICFNILIYITDNMIIFHFIFDLISFRLLVI